MNFVCSFFPLLSFTRGSFEIKAVESWIESCFHYLCLHHPPTLSSVNVSDHIHDQHTPKKRLLSHLSCETSGLSDVLLVSTQVIPFHSSAGRCVYSWGEFSLLSAHRLHYWWQLVRRDVTCFFTWAISKLDHVRRINREWSKGCSRSLHIISSGWWKDNSIAFMHW